ncbi:MAG: hypothetical protein AAF517_19585, partial [Planctomycetota bacterium]
KSWKLAVAAGESKNKKKAKDLYKAYQRAGSSSVLKERISWAFVRCGLKRAIPLLADDLTAPSEPVRRQAYEALRLMTTRRLPEFDAGADRATREAQAKEVRRAVGA